MRLGLPASLVLHAALAAAVLVASLSRPPTLEAGVDSVSVELVDFERDLRPETESRSDPATTPQPSPDATEETEPTPSPDPVKTPPQKKQERGRPLTDLSKIGKDLEKSDNRTGPTTSPRNTTGTRLVASEADAIKRRLETCWRSWEDVPDAESIIVVVRATFNPDGTLAGRPEVLREQSSLPAGGFARVAIDRSLNAFLSCQPFRMAPDRRQPVSQVFRFSPRAISTPP